MQLTTQPERHRTARVQSLDRGLAVLDAIAAAGGSMTVQELARTLHLSASTVSRLAATLRDRGLLTQDGGGAGYHLGLSLLRYAHSASLEHPLPTTAAPVMSRLVTALDDTVSLSVPTDDGMLYVRSDAPEGHILTIRISVGNTLPYTTTASGKAVLAAQPTAVVDAVLARGLDRRTDASIATAPELLGQIAAIRERGYAVEVGESSPEVACVAVAILARRGEPVGALSCNFPAMNASAQRVDQVAKQLTEGAREIEKALRAIP